VEIVSVAIGDTVGDVTLHVSGDSGMARVMRPLAEYGQVYLESRAGAR